MGKIFSRIFSDAYVHADVNVIQLAMYRFAYPFAVLLNKLHLSPNQITTQSLLFSILAFISLVYDDSWAWFSIFWAISVLLDFCDGTVARMTDSVSKPAFRYDHMSDLFKISLMFLGTGLRYDSSLVWLLSSSAIFLFMYFTVLNHDVHSVLRLAEKNKLLFANPEPVPISQVGLIRIRDRYRIVAWVAKYDSLFNIVRQIGIPLVTINGHTLLLFFLLPLGAEFAVWSLSYFGLIALTGIRARIAMLLIVPKP